MSICEFRIVTYFEKNASIAVQKRDWPRIREARLKSKPPVSQDDLAAAWPPKALFGSNRDFPN